ncbi:MAG: PPC domain-containing DNA-binding protein [Thermodesulfobacteriota bacterium]
MDKPLVESVKIDGVILSRLVPDQDLFTSLKRIAKDYGMERGVILSAIGSLKNVVFRNVKTNVDVPVKSDNTNEMEEAGPFELLSLEGNIFPSEGDKGPIIHLHVMLGSPSGNVMGGHLLKATVFTTAEIFIGKISESSVYKAKSNVTGLMELLKR